MSRGLGRVQRALLDRIEGEYADHRPELWLCVSTVDLGLNEHPESRRRAAHRLADVHEDDDIEVVTAPIGVGADLDRYRAGSIVRQQVFARLRLGEASYDYARELADEYVEHRGLLISERLDRDAWQQAWEWIKWYEAPLKQPHVHDLGVWMAS